MWESFLVSVNAVAPFLILLGIGALAIRMKWTGVSFMNRLNGLNFRLFFPFMMFNNIYGANPEDMPSLALMLGGALSVIVVILLLVLLVPRFVKENPRRGVIIQAIFRGNFVIYGIPLTTYVFGQEHASVCGVMVLIIVSIFNVASIIVLDLFRDDGKVTVKSLLLGLIKNPLLQGSLVGLVFYFFRIKLPPFLASPVSSLATVATTLGMIVLGADLAFDQMKANRKTILSVLGIRLILLPLIMVPLGYLIGLRGVELFLVLMIFGTPVATASFPMAQNMGGDGQLAGQLVFTSTVASLGTIFVFIYAMSRLGLLA